MTRFLNAERLAELTPIGVLIAVQYSNRRKFLSMFVLKGDLGRWKIISLSISSNLKKAQKINMRRDLLKIIVFFLQKIENRKLNWEAKLQANSSYSAFPQVRDGIVDSVARKVKYVAVEIVDIDSERSAIAAIVDVRIRLVWRAIRCSLNKT